MQLYDFQETAKRATYHSLRKHQTVVLGCPTGSGKTVIAQDIIKDGIQQGRRINFVCDRLTLIDQTVRRFRDDGIFPGVVQGNHPLWNPTSQAQVISVQTLTRRGLDSVPECDLWIVDECHCQYPALYEAMAADRSKKWIGLTATWFSRGMGLHWNDLVVGAKVSDLMRDGYLSPYEAWGPDTPDMKGVKIQNGEWVASGATEKMAPLTGNIYKHWHKLAGDEKTLGFCVSIDHAEQLTEEFRSHGVACDFVCARDTPEERRDKLQRFSDGDLQVMFNIEVLTKGYDQKDVTAGIIARPTRSLSTHIQIMGRMLRYMEGKTAKLIDHAGNIERLGFPDDPMPEKLCRREKGQSEIEEEKRENKEPKPWVCPKCRTVVPPKTAPCPCCGFMPKSQGDFTPEKGDLTKLSKANMMEKQEAYAMLNHIRQERGYKEGWAANQYRAMFGVWPRKIDTTATAVPNETVRNHVLSQQIRYAKRRQP